MWQLIFSQITWFEIDPGMNLFLINLSFMDMFGQSVKGFLSIDNSCPNNNRENSLKHNATNFGIYETIKGH